MGEGESPSPNAARTTGGLYRTVREKERRQGDRGCMSHGCGTEKMETEVDKRTLGYQLVNGKYTKEKSGKWYFENI